MTAREKVQAGCVLLILIVLTVAMFMSPTTWTRLDSLDGRMDRLEKKLDALSEKLRAPPVPAAKASRGP